MVPKPERYVEPRTGLLQAEPRKPLSALLALGAGAATSVLLFFGTGLLPWKQEETRFGVYFLCLWISVFAMLAFALVKRRWWLTLFFVLGAFPTAFALFLVFAFPC